MSWKSRWCCGAQPAARPLPGCRNVSSRRTGWDAGGLSAPLGKPQGQEHHGRGRACLTARINLQCLPAPSEFRRKWATGGETGRAHGGLWGEPEHLWDAPLSTLGRQMRVYRYTTYTHSRRHFCTYTTLLVQKPLFNKLLKIANLLCSFK